MATVQIDTSGVPKFALSRDKKTLTLRSGARWSVPKIFGGCPAPPPPDPPPAPELLAGFGPRADAPYPASPGDSAWSSAGFLVSTESADWSPLMCEDGPDTWLDLEPGAVEWSTEADGLQLETRFNWYKDAAPQQQSLWCGLATADRSTILAVGIQGERGMTGQAMSAIVKINGFNLLAGGNILALPGASVAGMALRLLLVPVAGGTSRAVVLQARDPAGNWEAWNADGSILTMNQGLWFTLLGGALAVVGGSLRPVLGVTHRAGGPAGGSYANFTRFRFA